ncbi:MAG: hypothetical protein WAM66_05730 [Acidobacteriaceae bacterium]
MTHTTVLAKCLVLFLTAQVGRGITPAQKHQPDFSLTISTGEETARAQGKQTYVGVNVTEKNTSPHTINIGRPANPADWYQMAVLFDGSPAPFTNFYKQLHQKRDPNAPIIADSFLGTLQPGKSRNFGVALSAYLDFSNPGTYEITFSRGTNPGQPDNVDVKSNTITITVLPANNPPPAQ